MSYVDKNLLGDEKVISRAKIHFFVYVPSILLAAYGIYLISSSPSDDVAGVGVFLFMLGLVFFPAALVKRKCTEFAITDKRVIAKHGWIARKTIEINLNKVEGLNVDQGVFGRIFNFGKVTVKGTGGANAPFKFIADPLALRKALNGQLGAKS